jgi:GNAT superfamily N-acetyltransferase
MENLIIRGSGIGDCPRLAELAAQLGYPCTASEVRARLPGCLANAARSVLVAELEHRVVGWTSLEVIDRFYVPRYAEISGLVVDEECRGRGIGRMLMEKAESWARSKGCGLLRLKTNSIRKEAHRFYEHLGFEKSKEQFVYAKSMVP